MKKKLLALFLAAAMVGAAAGCSQNGGSGTSSGGESGASQSSGESQEPSGEVITLRCGGWGRIDTEHEAGVVGMAEAIGINVEFQKYPTDADFWNNLPAQIAALSKQAPLGSPSGATSTLVTFLYQQSFAYMDMGYGSAAAVILFLVIFALSAVRELAGRRTV